MSTQDKIKVGIIGSGKRGIMHASLVNINPRAEWKAICVSNKKSLSYLQNFYPGIPFFLDTREMLETVILDTIFICTPDNTHLSLVREVSKKDMNIFVEKPLAESLVSSKKLVDLISSRNNVYSTGYYSSFKVLFQEAKVLLNNNILDRIKRYRASLFYTLPQSSRSIDRIIRDMASSFFYLIKWFFGDSLKIYLYKKKGRFERGWTVIHRTDLPSPSRFFLCEEGYFEGNSSFINSCSDKKKPAVPWEDGLEITRMIEAADLSINSNRVIFLSEVK